MAGCPSSAWLSAPVIRRLRQARATSSGHAPRADSLGYLAGVGLAFGLAVLTALVILSLTAVGLSATSDETGRVLGQTQIVVTAVAFLALTGRLDVDALRDLSAKRRVHARLDVARLVATVAGVAYLAGVAVRATGHPDFDYIGEVLSFGAVASWGRPS